MAKEQYAFKVLEVEVGGAAKVVLKLLAALQQTILQE